MNNPSIRKLLKKYVHAVILEVFGSFIRNGNIITVLQVYAIQWPIHSRENCLNFSEIWHTLNNFGDLHL